MRQPTTTATCDTPNCKETITYLYIDPPGDWFFGRHGDHCPLHAANEIDREWRPFNGPKYGTKGWQSLKTNRILYQDPMPQNPMAHEGISAEEA